MRRHEIEDMILKLMDEVRGEWHRFPVDELLSSKLERTEVHSASG